MTIAFLSKLFDFGRTVRSRKKLAFGTVRLTLETLENREVPASIFATRSGSVFADPILRSVIAAPLPTPSEPPRSIFYASPPGGPVLGALNMSEPIRAKYAATANEYDINGRSVREILGIPLNGERIMPNGTRYVTFSGDPFAGTYGGTIYWSQATGAHVVYGSIRTQYNALSRQVDAYGSPVKGILGLPISDETGTGAGGRVVHFQGGDIYWTPANPALGRTGGAFEVYGDIRSRYNALGGPNGFLGLPLTGEVRNSPLNSGTIDRVQIFANGNILWTPGTGAHEMHGPIAQQWSAAGVASKLGYPTSGVFKWTAASPDGLAQTFERGTIVWTPRGGARVEYAGQATVSIQIPLNVQVGAFFTATLSATDILGRKFNGPVTIGSSDGQSLRFPAGASSTVNMVNGAAVVTLAFSQPGTVQLWIDAGSVRSVSSPITAASGVVAPTRYQFTYNLIAVGADGNRIALKQVVLTQPSADEAAPALVSTLIDLANKWQRELYEAGMWVDHINWQLLSKKPV